MTAFDYQAFVANAPHFKGRLVADAPLAKLSWFRTGGAADILFEPASEADLIAFLRLLPTHVPLTVLGVGSNILIRDGGVEGAVIRLGRAFSRTEMRGDIVKAGAGAMDIHVAKEALKAGLAGLEFMVGIPGTVGGAVAMNAGAYGREIKDIFLHARAVDHLGHLHELNRSDFDFAYRRSGLASGMILLDASFQARHGDPVKIREQMEEIVAARQDSQPLGTRTGGSTFKNPDGLKAWELIERAGCRGKRIGDAQISEKHCNFLINHGGASAHQLETLVEEVRAAVHDKTGVALEWEVKRIGRRSAGEQAND